MVLDLFTSRMQETLGHAQTALVVSLSEKFNVFIALQAFQATVRLICFNLNLLWHLATIPPHCRY